MLENKHKPLALQFPPAFIFGPRLSETPETPTPFLKYPISSTFVNSTAKNLGCIAPHGCRYKSESQTRLIYSGISFVSIYFLFASNNRILNPIVIIVFSQFPQWSFLRIQSKFPQGFSRPQRRWRFQKCGTVHTFLFAMLDFMKRSNTNGQRVFGLLSCSIRVPIKHFFCYTRHLFFCGASHFSPFFSDLLIFL